MSFSQQLLQLFPVPRLIALSGGGVELSERTVKYLQLEPTNRDKVKRFSVKTYGSEPIPKGAIIGGEIQDPDALRGVLQIVRRKVGTPHVHLSLPEQKGYVFQASFPRTEDLSVREAIAFMLEERVPLSAEEATFDCEILPQSDENVIWVNVTVFPRKTVESHHAVLTEAGFTPLSFEMESQAAARTLQSRRDMTSMIVDFGDTRTSVFVVDRGFVLFTTSLEIAGVSLEAALQKSLNVDEAEADRLKNEEGILTLSQGGKVAGALISTISALRDEVGRLFVYWQTHAVDADKIGHPIEEVVLIGGNANLRGLAEYLGQALRVPVRLPNIWENIADLSSYVPPIPRNESFRYATVAGLALRAFGEKL